MDTTGPNYEEIQWQEWTRLTLLLLLQNPDRFEGMIAELAHAADRALDGLPVEMTRH